MCVFTEHRFQNKWSSKKNFFYFFFYYFFFFYFFFLLSFLFLEIIIELSTLKNPPTRIESTNSIIIHTEKSCRSILFHIFRQFWNWSLIELWQNMLLYYFSTSSSVRYQEIKCDNWIMKYSGMNSRHIWQHNK